VGVRRTWRRVKNKEINRQKYTLAFIMILLSVNGAILG